MLLRFLQLLLLNTASPLSHTIVFISSILFPSQIRFYWALMSFTLTIRDLQTPKSNLSAGLNCAQSVTMSLLASANISVQIFPAINFSHFVPCRISGNQPDIFILIIPFPPLCYNKADRLIIGKNEKGGGEMRQVIQSLYYKLRSIVCHFLCINEHACLLIAILSVP